jgi:hypothetical protein
MSGARKRRRLAVAAAVTCLASVGLAGPAAAATETGEFTGTFRTAAGSPIGDARVQAINAQTRYPEAGTITGQDGAYTLRLRPGTYLLKFVQPDWSEQYSPQQTAEHRAAEYTVAAGATVTVHETVIARGSVAGRLVDAAGAPAGGSEVALYPTGDDDHPLFADVTGADGNFQARVPAGRYRVSFTLPSNSEARQFVPRKLRLADAIDVEVTGDQTTIVNEKLLRTGVIAGRVLTADCKPMSADVILYANDEESAGHSRTDANGAFRLEVFPGRYRIGFHWESFSRTQYFTGAETLDEATVYTVAAGKKLSVVDHARLPAR